MAMRWRWPPENSWGSVPSRRVDADLLQGERNPLLALLGSHGRVLDQQAFLDDLTDRQAWRQRAIGVLEDDLHLLAQRAHLATLKGLDVAAKIEDRTFRGGEPQESKTESGLAGTDSPTTPSVWPARTRTSTPSTALTYPTVRLSKPRLIGNQTLRRRASTITGAEGTKEAPSLGLGIDELSGVGCCGLANTSLVTPGRRSRRDA